VIGRASTHVISRVTNRLIRMTFFKTQRFLELY
jgi:hypothetical protein